MDEREIFEARIELSTRFSCDFTRGAISDYADPDTQRLWLAWQAGRRTTPEREAIIEECAKVCDEYSVDRWNLFKGRKPYEGTESGRADPYTYGASDGADQCSERIRALKTSPTSDKGGA